MTVTLATFIEGVVSSGLLSREKLRALLVDCRPPATTTEAVARELIRTGRLTQFQVATIAAGKGRSLLLGVYEIQDFLGAGGMGHVYLAEHRRMGRRVALKVLPPQLMRDPQAVRRFQREVQAAARLTHPNIVTAYDANDHKGVHYFVMEYVEGRDLAALLKQRGPMSVPLAVACAIQVARGLEYAHAAGIIHRDIKPANLLLTQTGIVKILDMGLARMAGRGARSVENADDESGTLMGTVDFMAPEQTFGHREADARSDIYSLGCTLFMLLTGRAVFPQQSVAKKLQAMRTQPAPSLRAVRPEVSQLLESVYQRMVAREPSDRYQSMTQVLTTLERLADRPSKVRFKTYGDPALREISAPAQRREAAMGSGAKPLEMDFSFLKPLTASEFDATAPAPVRVLPPLRRRRRWSRRIWLMLLGAAAVIVMMAILALATR